MGIRLLRIQTFIEIVNSSKLYDHFKVKAGNGSRIFFLANLILKQGIRSEYVMVDFLCKLGLQGAKTENYKMKNRTSYHAR